MAAGAVNNRAVPRYPRDRCGPLRCSPTSAAWTARPTPSTTSGQCNSRPGTTRPPPPATGRPWHCSAKTGNRLGQAEALNRLGELSSRTSATGQAREHHAKARAIARDLRAPLEEARSLEGTGRTCLQDGNNDEGLDCLRRALTIYQRIGAPGALRVKETLRNPSLAENAEHLLCPAVAARARCSIAAPNGGYGSSTGGRPRSQGATPGAGAGLALR